MSSAILSVAAIKAWRTPRSCVDTSAAFPVTPVAVAITPNNSSWLTFNCFVKGTTLPIDPSNSGNVVCPNFAVRKARSETFWFAAAEVSPYPFVTADKRLILSVTSALPAFAPFDAISNIFALSAVSPNAETT